MSRNTLELTKAPVAMGAPTRPDDQFTSSQFGPWSPIQPFPIDAGPEPRYTEYRPGFNLPTAPGTDKLVPFELLKQASKICIPLRRALEIRKEELSTQEWDISLKQRYAKTLKPEAFAQTREALIDFFSQPNRYEKVAFGDFIRESEENVAVLDAWAVYFRRTLGPRAGALNSGLAALEVIDGATISPKINVRGGTPQPPAVAYQQHLYGAPRLDFMAPIVEEDFDNPVVMQLNAEQLYYRKFTRIPGSIYGFSNVESSLLFVKLWFDRVMYHKNYFDESSLPAGFLSMPADWKMDAIKGFEADLNRQLSANGAWRWRIKAVPNSAAFTQLKPIQYGMDFDDWLITQLASCMDVTAEELGVTPRHGLGGKGWAEAAGQRQIRLALQPRLTFYAEFFNWVILAIFGIKELEFKFLDPDQTDKLEAAQADNYYVNNGTRSRNEVREERGWDKSDEPEADQLMVTTSQGVTRLADTEALVQQKLTAPQLPPGASAFGAPATPEARPPATGAPAEPASSRSSGLTASESRKDAGGVETSLGLQPYDLAGEGKASKASVRYADRSIDADQCRRCVHYQGSGVCALVAGDVDPRGWCERFSADALKAALAELGRWERYASSRADMGARPFVCTHLAADVAGPVQLALTDAAPADLPVAVWRAAVFAQARDLVKSAAAEAVSSS